MYIFIYIRKKIVFFSLGLQELLHIYLINTSAYFVLQLFICDYLNYNLFRLVKVMASISHTRNWKVIDITMVQTMEYIFTLVN